MPVQLNANAKGNAKGKAHPKTEHEGPDYY